LTAINESSVEDTYAIVNYTLVKGDPSGDVWTEFLCQFDPDTVVLP
jgi:hypothetical protein